MNKQQLLQEYDKDLSKKLILAILEGGAHTEEEITKELNAIRKVLSGAFKEIESKAYNRGFCEGVKAQQDVIEKEYQASLKGQNE